MDIYHSNRNKFNVVNLATLIHKIAKLSKQRHQFDFRLWNQDKNDFIRSFYNRINSLITHFNSQELANTIWAMATLKVNHSQLISMIANESIQKISQFNCQELVNTIWALATLKVNHPQLTHLISSKIVNKISQFNPQDLANTIWVLATLKLNDSQLINIISQECIKKISQFSCQNLANTIWALATLKVNHSQLTHLIASESIHKISQFSRQDLANTIWALATLNSYHSELFSRIASLVKKHLANFNKTNIRQIYYVYLVAKYIWKIDDIDDLLPLNVIKPFFNLQKIEVNPSKLQKEVFQFVSQQINCQNEFITEEFLSIDIAIQESRIAIEVNGPYHYLSDKSLDGSSNSKYRLLEQLGWEVIVISYSKWDELSTTDKTNYINDLLNSSVC